MSKKDEVPEKCLSKALLTRLAESTVAPFVGAWIETHHGLVLHHFQTSHPSWVRGLKQLTNLIKEQMDACRTLRGCVD